MTGDLSTSQTPSHITVYKFSVTLMNLTFFGLSDNSESDHIHLSTFS